MVKKLIFSVLLIVSFNTFGFEIADWHGTWERYDAEGNLVERIVATESVPGAILTSVVEYFADNQSVAKGAVVMSQRDNNISLSFHIAGGTVLRGETLSATDNSILIRLERTRMGQEPLPTIFTRFTRTRENNEEVMLQDVFNDEAATNKTLSVVFKKIA